MLLSPVVVTCSLLERLADDFDSDNPAVPAGAAWCFGKSSEEIGADQAGAINTQTANQAITTMSLRESRMTTSVPFVHLPIYPMFEL